MTEIFCKEDEHIVSFIVFGENIDIVNLETKLSFVYLNDDVNLTV